MKKLIISSIIMVLNIHIIIRLSTNTRIILADTYLMKIIGLVFIMLIIIVYINAFIIKVLGFKEGVKMIFSILGTINLVLQTIAILFLIYILAANEVGLTSILFEIGGIKIEKYIYTADEINELISQMAKNYQVTLTSTEIQELQKCTNPKMIKDELLKIGARWVISQFSIREILSLVLIRIFVTKGQQPKRKQSKRKQSKRKQQKKK